MLLPSTRRSELSLCALLLCLGLCAVHVARAEAPPPEPPSSSEATSVEAGGLAPAEDTDAGPPEAEPLGQPNANDLARQLFQRGLQLAEREDFAGAAKSFSEALALRDAPAVEYNLAAALAELHQYEEAYNRTQRVLANPETPEGVRDRAKQLELSLQAHVARLTVVTSGTQNDLIISVDEHALDSALLGRAQAVPPGKHEVVATRAGATVSSRSLEIPLRTAGLVDVSLVVTELDQKETKMEVSTSVVPLAVPPPAAVPVDTDADARRTRRRWIGITAGVLAVAAGVTLGVLLAKSDESRQEPLQGDTGVLTW